MTPVKHKNKYNNKRKQNMGERTGAFKGKHFPAPCIAHDMKSSFTKWVYMKKIST